MAYNAVILRLNIKMSRSNKFTEDSQLVAVRLPKNLRAEAKKYCAREDLTLSQLMRRAVKKELAVADGETEVGAV